MRGDRIARVDVYGVEIPLSHPYRDATRTETSSRDALVCITTGDGAIGWGAGAPRRVPTGETLESTFAVLREIAPLLLNADPFAIAALHLRLRRALPFNHAAICAIDLAVHDLVGRLLGRPVYDLLGGLVRDTMPAFELLPLDSPERMAELGAEARERGIRTFKVKVDADVITGLERVARLRRAVSDATIIVDANTSWVPAEAVVACRSFAAEGVTIVEQPVAAWDLDGLAFVRGRAGVRIAADESMRPDYLPELVRRRVVDVMNIKLNREGGLLPAKHIAAVAEVTGFEVIAGSVVQNALLDAACAHFFASTPVVGYNESGKAPAWHPADIAHGLVVADGVVHVPEGPGLGVTVDLQAVSRFAAWHETISAD